MAANNDEQDVPFRWSLFLPAAGDSPGMRGMKYAVIGMGVILILGFFIILARIVYLTSRMDASLPEGAALSVAVAPGAEVTTLSLSGNRLALHLRGPAAGERSIMIVDLASGRVVSRLRLEPDSSSGANASVPRENGAAGR